MCPKGLETTSTANVDSTANVQTTVAQGEGCGPGTATANTEMPRDAPCLEVFLQRAE